MVAMEHGGHGHDSHESGGHKKHNTWMERGFKVLGAIGIGVAVAAFAPSLLVALGTTVPPNIMGAAGALWYLSGDSDTAHKGKPEEHH